MEALTRLVADSLTRHGLDRPIDPRRLQWSRWFRCDSPHSLLVIPSKPGIFALAEEIMDMGVVTAHMGAASTAHVETAAPGCPERSSAAASSAKIPEASSDREGHDFSRAVSSLRNRSASAAEGIIDGNQRPECVRRMLAVLQFSEDDDMAYVLDRMFTRINPMRSRLASGRCFVRFVVIEDQDQRRTICTALNQWLISSAEKASGIGADFSSSLELTESLVPSTTPHLGTAALGCPSERSSASGHAASPKANAITHLDSGAARNLHCPQPLPSGF